MSRGKRQQKWKGEPVVLFVEGYSDLCFYAEMLEHCGFQEGECFIQELGGNGRTFLVEQSRLLLKPDELDRIKQVVVAYDSDGSVQASFDSARDSLRESQQVQIGEPFAFVTKGSTTFSVVIAGGDNSRQPEEIETLAVAALHGGGQGVLTCVEGYLRCLKEKGMHLRSPDKVKLGAALAVLHEEDPRLGPAAKANKFNLDSPALGKIAQHFRAMREKVQAAQKS
jgi:hypothetical protein